MVQALEGRRQLRLQICAFSRSCGTAHARLRLHGQPTLKATLGYISDSDDASNVDHRRSLGCVLGFIGAYFDRSGPEKCIGKPAFFSWKAFWTIHVTSGSMISEIYSFAEAYREALTMRPLLGEIGFPQKKPTKVLSHFMCCQENMLLAPKAQNMLSDA